MKNVLIVEDQRMARESMESYIRKSGQYRLVDSIANAALAEMCCTRQPVDLVLMDVCTENDESGFVATKDIKSRFPNLKVIIVTSMLDAGYLNRAREVGADSIYFKDVSQMELMKVVERTMSGESVYPDKTPEERQRMLEDWLKKHQASQPKLVGDKNPGHSKNTTELERKQRSPKCIEFYELRYPDLSHEDHLRMLNEHKSNVTKILQDPKNQVLCVEHWLDKGYTIEEAEQKLNEEYQKRSFTLEKCIKKYGEEEGRKKFEDRQIKWQKSLKKHFEYYGDSRSPQSEFAIYLIGRIYRSLKLRKPLTEKYIKDKTTNRAYAYDFCYKNIIIEFNGDYWHMNPAKYNADDINKTTKQRAIDKWNEDAYKKALAEKYGYKVLVIWESEFNKSMKETLDKCLSFIHDNVSN